jgi:hypothetical protein
VNANDFKSRKNDNYSDRVTYQACEKLAAAHRYYREYHTAGHNEDDAETFDRISNLESLPQPLTNASDQGVIRRLVEENPEMVFDAVRYLMFNFAVPILVLDDNRRFVETTLENDGRVRFGQELEVALYPHVLRTSE